MKESAPEVYREAGTSLSAVPMRRDRTLCTKAQAGQTRFRAVTKIEGAVVNTMFDLFTEITQRPPVRIILLHDLKKAKVRRKPLLDRLSVECMADRQLTTETQSKHRGSAESEAFKPLRSLCALSVSVVSFYPPYTQLESALILSNCSCSDFCFFLTRGRSARCRLVARAAAVHRRDVLYSLPTGAKPSSDIRPGRGSR